MADARLVGAVGNIPNINKTYKKYISMGEGAKADDFRMVFEDVDGGEDIEFLVQATQMPELKRENVETYGPHGVKFQQAGKFLNAGDITITFKEVIEGKAYEFLRKNTGNKQYMTIKLGLVSESKGSSPESNTVKLEDAWIEMDALDLSVEDGTTLVKPSGTIHYNWCTYLDEESETLDWGA